MVTVSRPQHSRSSPTIWVRKSGRPSVRPGSGSRAMRRRTRAARRSHLLPSRAANSALRRMRASSTTATATRATSTRAAHATASGPQPWRLTTTSPRASRMYFVQVAGAGDQHLGGGVTEGEAPRAQHRVVEPGGDRAALGHGVRQGGAGGVGHRGLAHPQPGEGHHDRGPVGGEVDHAQHHRDQQHLPGDEGGGRRPVARLQVGQQVPDGQGDDAVAEQPRDDPPADGARPLGGQPLLVDVDADVVVRCRPLGPAHASSVEVHPAPTSEVGPGPATEVSSSR